MAEKIQSKILEIIHAELKKLSESSKDHICFDTNQSDPYPIASIIGSYIKKEFPNQFYLKIDPDKVGGQIFVYKK